MNCFHLEIVSPELAIFSGLAQKLFVTGILGELEVLAGHAPLLTELAPGPIWVVDSNGHEDGFVIFGGMLEVQPNITIVLADAAMRGTDIDEAAANSAKRSTEHAIASKAQGLNYAKAHQDLTLARAQLTIVRKLKSLHK